MGYTVRIRGISRVASVMPDQATRKELYMESGRLDSSFVEGPVNHESFVYVNFHDNLFYTKTAATETHSFEYSGSWSAGTMEAFWQELRDYAYSQGLAYSIPIRMGLSGMLWTAASAKHAAELEAIAEAATKEAPQWSNPSYGRWLQDLVRIFALGAQQGLVWYECD